MVARVSLVAVAAGFAVLLTGCGARPPLSATEQKMVGTWDYTGLDSTYRWVFNASRSLTVLSPDIDYDQNHRWLRAATGTWRVDGDVVSIDAVIHLGPPAGEKQHWQFRILDFGRDKLVREGSVPYIRVK
jgi:hypothetical protein